LVEVFDVRDGRKDMKPIVIPELVLENRRWVFVNLHYPEGGNLLSILRENHEQRKKMAK
jgi:hypothetical protein